MKKTILSLICVFAYIASIKAVGPVNDYCGNALLLNLSSNSCRSGITINGTQTSPPSDCNGNSLTYSDDDVWYKFFAESTSHTLTVTSDLSFEAVVDVKYTCGSSTLYCGYDSINQSGTTGTIDTTKVVMTNLTIGKQYYVRVYSYKNGNSAQGTFDICLSGVSSQSTTAPTNDSCTIDKAKTIVSEITSKFSNGTTIGATQSSMPAANCWGAINATPDDDVWYKFNAVSSSHIITVQGLSGFVPMFELRESCASSSALYCSYNKYSSLSEMELVELTIGTTYYIRIYSLGADQSNQGNFRISVTHKPIPENDDCNKAIVLTSSTAFNYTSGTTIGANKSGSPTLCDGGLSPTGDSDDDVWYKFTAKETKHTVNILAETDFEPVVEVRLDCGSSINYSIACSSNLDSLGGKLELNDLIIDQLYYIRMYSYGPVAESNSRGNFQICVTHDGVTPPPANDGCTGAVSLNSNLDLTSPTTLTQGSTFGATQSAQLSNCDTMGYTNDDVWYKFSAKSTYQDLIVRGSPNFYPIVDVREGCANQTTTNICGLEMKSKERITLTGLTKGKLYLVRVYGKGKLKENRGSFEITVAKSSKPDNDECHSAQRLIPDWSDNFTEGSTVLTTKSPQSVDCGTSTSVDDDIWYKFSSSTSDAVKVIVESSTQFNPVISVVKGCTSGSSIVCSTTQGNTRDSVILKELSENTYYYVRVYSNGSSSSSRGNFKISVTKLKKPDNDNCYLARALDNSSPNNFVSGTTIAATRSLQDKVCDLGVVAQSDDDVWYKFRSLSPTLKINIENEPGFSAAINVLKSCNYSDIMFCAKTDAERDSFYLQDLSVGATYYIRVYSKGGKKADQGNFRLSAWSIPRPSNDNCYGLPRLYPSSTCNYVDGTTMGATKTTHPYPFSLPGGASDDDVWYYFNATGKDYTISVEALNGLDAVVEVLNKCDFQTGIAYARQSSGMATVKLKGLTVGANYFVRVYSYSSNVKDQGDFKICLQNGATAQLNRLANPDDLNDLNENIIENSGSLSLFPNPSSGLFTLKIDGGHEINTSATLRIINLQGQELINNVIVISENFTHTFDIQGFPSGVYLVQFITSDTIYNKHVFLQEK